MKKISAELVDYIETSIIPRYESFDAAHRTDHVRTVIRQSLELACHYEVDPDMVYAIAAFHDTGLTDGREKHHLRSGEILVSDHFLQAHFTADELHLMREAVEDHRASADHAPRSIYGRIVAEADRCLEPRTVVRRTIQYGKAHYPALSRHEQLERCKEHLARKYGEQGYLHLWIPESDNLRLQAQLRALIADEKGLKRTFDEIYDSLYGEN